MAKYKTAIIMMNDKDTQVLRRDVLEKHDLAETVDTVMNGFNAVDFLNSLERNEKGEYPKLIIFLDIQDPRKDGLAFLKAFKALPAEIRNAVTVKMVKSSKTHGTPPREHEADRTEKHFGDEMTLDQVKKIADEL